MTDLTAEFKVLLVSHKESSCASWNQTSVVALTTGLLLFEGGI